MDLRSVTLCCVDSRRPALALAALERCRQGLRFAEVLLCTDRRRLQSRPEGIRIVDTRIDSSAAYSMFMLKELVRHVRTPHVLIVQWDGFVFDPQAWDPAFLNWDYIGAPWPQFERGRAVGNGGFSLRSRALLQALADPAVLPTHPEDLCICHEQREFLERQGLRIAPLEVAERFAFERGEPSGSTFGFHGLFNVHKVLDAPALQDFLLSLPAELTAGIDGKDLCRALIRNGQFALAGVLLRKRFASRGWLDGHTLRLALRWGWARLRGQACLPI